MAGSDMNIVALVGRLTRDAEIAYLASGTAAVTLAVAVNRSRREGDQFVSEVNYFDLVYYGKSAEAVKQYLTKGKQIAVQGSLKQDRWEKDGQKFSKVRVIVNSLELLGGRSDNGGQQSYGSPSGGYQPRADYGAGRSSGAETGGFKPQSGAAVENSFGGESTGFPEDIPF